MRQHQVCTQPPVQGCTHAVCRSAQAARQAKQAAASRRCAPGRPLLGAPDAQPLQRHRRKLGSLRHLQGCRWTAKGRLALSSASLFLLPWLLQPAAGPCWHADAVAARYLSVGAALHRSLHTDRYNFLLVEQVSGKAWASRGMQVLSRFVGGSRGQARWAAAVLLATTPARRALWQHGR